MLEETNLATVKKENLEGNITSIFQKNPFTNLKVTNEHRKIHKSVKIISINLTTLKTNRRTVKTKVEKFDASIHFNFEGSGN